MRRTVSLVLLALLVALVVTAVVTIRRSGGFSARAEPTKLERVLARVARRLAVPADARDARNPVPFTPDAWREARAHFADHCATCHGNDGRGDTDIGRNLYPKAPDMQLADTQDLTDGQLYWIIENGVRLTGMPAWGDGATDDTETWKLVHFVRHLKDLTPEQLAEMQTLNPKTAEEREEEQQDRAFLDGNAPNPQPPEPAHTHSHKE